MMWGQTPVVPIPADEEHFGHRKETPVNFGFKGGFTSSLFLVSQFSVNGVPIDEVQNNYKIGYFGSLFMRINFDRHFLQPEISYNINRCNITFEKPLPEDAASGAGRRKLHYIVHPQYRHPRHLRIQLHQGGAVQPCRLWRTKVRYIWDRKSDIDFENFDQVNIRERLRPLNLSFTVGVSVTISRVFFDFRYDMGLHNISKNVTYDIPADNNAADENTKNEIRFHRRDNVLSFSFGVFF